jgi:hypothetical protein
MWKKIKKGGLGAENAEMHARNQEQKALHLQPVIVGSGGRDDGRVLSAVIENMAM